MYFKVGDKVTNGSSAKIRTIKSFNERKLEYNSDHDTVEYVEGGYDWLGSIIFVSRPEQQMQFSFMKE